MIRDHGVEYERNHMDTKLCEGDLSLTRTRPWLHATIREELVTGWFRIHDTTIHDSAKDASFITVLNAGAVALITDVKPRRVAMCPETILLDVTRLARMQADCRCS